MFENIPKFYERAGLPKIEFRPEVKVLTKNGPVWIDNIFKIRDTLMITISTKDDKIPMKLDDMEDPFKHGVLNRLNFLYN